MKHARSILVTTRHATVVLCTMLVLLAAVSAQKHVPTKKMQSPCAVSNTACPVPKTVMATCGCVLYSSSIPCGGMLGNDLSCPSLGSAITLYDDNNGGVLNLDGRRILGSSPPLAFSIGIDADHHWTIMGQVGLAPVSANHGPGEINGFDTGIQFESGWNSVTHVHLINNNTGIEMNLDPGNSITANTLIGNSCYGILIPDEGEGSDSVVNNLVTGSTGSSTACPPNPGMGIYVGYTEFYPNLVQGNSVNHNNIGMCANLDGGESITVSGNDFSANSQQGAYIYYGEGITVSGNFFNRNGQDGLWLDYLQNAGTYASVIQNNFSNDNKGHGITLTNSGGSSPANLLTGNVALHNNTYDLFWDGLGQNNWPAKSNTCDTSSPSSIVCN